MSLSSQSDIAITSTGTTTISGADVDMSLSGAASTFDVIDSAASPILRASTGGTTFQKAVQASAGATLSGASTVLGTLNVQSGASFTADAGSTITFNSLPNFNRSEFKKFIIIIIAIRLKNSVIINYNIILF